MVLPIVALPYPWGLWFEEIWMYIISERFHVNITYSSSVVLEKIFKGPHHIFAFLWLSPLWKGLGSLFEQFRVPFTQEWFVPSLSAIVLMVLEKNILFNINICKDVSLLWLLPTPGDHDVNNSASTSYKKAFLKIWSILAQWFWRRF
jgi:hypothetical protein